MNNSKQIAILGCGWLGFPLAKSLVASGYKVKGSVRQKRDLKKQAHSGIAGFLLDVRSENVTGDVNGFLANSDVLIICIPPGLRNNPTESYVEKIQSIIPFIEGQGINKVIFISSTSVYANDNSLVTEETIPLPETESGRQILKVERFLLERSKFQTTVLRFGGLIGPDRHPVDFLVGKKNLKNPQAPVNLIHRDDCTNIIAKIIEQDIWRETFNAAAPFHPTREKFYVETAKSRGIEVPVFNQEFRSYGKIISSRKLQQTINYQFIRDCYELF